MREMSNISRERQTLYELWYLLDTMRWLSGRAAGALMTVDKVPMDDGGHAMDIAEQYQQWKPAINVLRRAMCQAEIIRPQDNLTPDLIREDLFNWLAVKHSLNEEESRLLPVCEAVRLLGTPTGGATGDKTGFLIEIRRKGKWAELYRAYNELAEKWSDDCLERRRVAVDTYMRGKRDLRRSDVSDQLGRRIREQKNSGS